MATEQEGHTPGPWQHYDDSADATHRHQIAAFGKTVAHVYCTKGDETSDAANARLIAAAPDLLEAARRALNFIQNTEDEFGDNLPSGDALRAAIARATGEA